ncbi:MAG: hypothetical protein PHU85_13535 [Phycisphaerae bacterium]|nr:hypothetical protein [Phycisphaerae bacterium]
MKKSLFALYAAAALLAPLGCHRLPPEPAPSPQLVLWDRSWSYLGNPGQEILTPHYHIYTTHTDAVFLARLPQFLENAFTHYQQFIRPTKKPDGPMDVYLFGQRDQWDRFTAESTGPAASIYRKIQEGGYVDNGRAVFYDIHRLKTFAVTGHEGFHQYIWHYTRHRPPAWIDEGIACYFETFYWDGDALTFEPRRNMLRLSALRYGLTDKTLLDVHELLSTHPGNVIGSSPGKVASYYSQLWALILFLQDDPAYKSRFAKLLSDVGSQKMVELAAASGYNGQGSDFGPAVFRAYITADLPAFKTQFQAYCVKLAGF